MNSTPPVTRPRHLSEQLTLLRLARQLATEAAQFRHGCQVSPNECLESLVTYKSVTIRLQRDGEFPVFRLSHESNPNGVFATLASPAPAARIAIECHRVYNLGTPRYEIQREPFIGLNYETRFACGSVREAIKAFMACETAFEGGDLIIWDRHEYAVAARREWSSRREHGEIAGWSSRHVYVDPEFALAAQLLNPREAQREGISVGAKMKL